MKSNYTCWASDSVQVLLQSLETVRTCMGRNGCDSSLAKQSGCGSLSLPTPMVRRVSNSESRWSTLFWWIWCTILGSSGTLSSSSDPDPWAVIAASLGDCWVNQPQLFWVLKVSSGWSPSGSSRAGFSLSDSSKSKLAMAGIT